MEETKNNNKTTEESEELKNKLAACEKEKEEYLNGWKRAKADFINYQKDEIKRMAEIIKLSNESLIKELLTVLDSFEISLAIMDNADENLKKGVEMIYFQLEKTLNKFGLEPIKALGMKFDENFHETVEEIESEKESGTILEELIRGWKLNGKVIRPTKVKISK